MAISSNLHTISQVNKEATDSESGNNYNSDIKLIEEIDYKTLPISLVPSQINSTKNQ